MKYFIIYALCLATSMYFVNIESDNFIFSVIAPIGIGTFILLIIGWLILKGANNQSNTVGSTHFSDIGDSGGDS